MKPLHKHRLFEIFDKSHTWFLKDTDLKDVHLFVMSYNPGVYVLFYSLYSTYGKTNVQNIIFKIDKPYRYVRTFELEEKISKTVKAHYPYMWINKNIDINENVYIVLGMDGIKPTKEKSIPFVEDLYDDIISCIKDTPKEEPLKI